MTMWERCEGLVRSCGGEGWGEGVRDESQAASQCLTMTVPPAPLPLPRPVCGPVEKLSQVPGLWVSLHDLRGFL